MKCFASILGIGVIGSVIAFESFAHSGSTAAHYAQPLAQTPSTPRVSAEFQPEVSQLAATGLQLKEAVEASLDGHSKHLAAIFERTGSKDLLQRFEFRIFESDGQATKTIFRRAEFVFSFGANGSSKLNATDINGDGLKEIIVQSSSGGNCWSCNPTEIYRVSNHKAELIAAAPIRRIADLNGDGIVELLTTDARWESYGDLSHAASPFAVMIYAWKDGKYVYASRDFAVFYKEEIDRLRTSVEEGKADINADDFSDEGYIGSALSLAITYAHAGEIELGIKELETLLNSNAKSAAQKKRRAAILEDFRNGESAKKLRMMKYGDPLPLG
ncbi:MAG: VCBS repeat-containing protein [Blastocatellia bacterium]